VRPLNSAFNYILKCIGYIVIPHLICNIRGPFERFVDWRQCAAVMQREAVTVMPSCRDEGNVVVARSSSL
jgi:hypothetical protein